MVSSQYTGMTLWEWLFLLMFQDGGAGESKREKTGCGSEHDCWRRRERRTVTVSSDWALAQETLSIVNWTQDKSPAALVTKCSQYFKFSDVGRLGMRLFFSICTWSTWLKRVSLLARDAWLVHVNTLYDIFCCFFFVCFTCLAVISSCSSCLEALCTVWNVIESWNVYQWINSQCNIIFFCPKWHRLASLVLKHTGGPIKWIRNCPWRS